MFTVIGERINMTRKSIRIRVRERDEGDPGIAARLADARAVLDLFIFLRGSVRVKRNPQMRRFFRRPV